MRKHSQVPDSMHCSLHLVRPLPLNALVVLQLHKEAEAEKKKVSCPAMPTNDGPPICQGALSTHCMWGSVFGACLACLQSGICSNSTL